MYCPINNSETNECRCTTRCCRLYDFALGFLAVLILFAVGIIIGVSFVTTFIEVIPILITATVILFILFLVTLLTRGCCNTRNQCNL